MTINSTAAVALAMYLAAGRRAGHLRRKARPGRFRTTSSRNTSRAGPTSFPRGRRCASSPTSSPICRGECPELEHDFDQRLPHPRGGRDRRPGAGVHPGQRRRIRPARPSTPASRSTCSLPRLSFFFAAHNDLLEEVAKFRAARRIWARDHEGTIRERPDPAQMLRFHTQTGGATLTAQQPDNNVVRVALQALAAVLGGTQCLHTNSLDEALALPTEESVRLALRTQQVIAYESGATDTVDPLAGSYYVEALTNRIEAEAGESWTGSKRRAGRSGRSSPAGSSGRSRTAPSPTRNRSNPRRASWSGSTNFPTPGKSSTSPSPLRPSGSSAIRRRPCGG